MIQSKGISTSQYRNHKPRTGNCRFCIFPFFLVLATLSQQRDLFMRSLLYNVLTTIKTKPVPNSR